MPTKRVTVVYTRPGYYTDTNGTCGKCGVPTPWKKEDVDAANARAKKAGKPPAFVTEAEWKKMQPAPAKKADAKKDEVVDEADAGGDGAA